MAVVQQIKLPDETYKGLYERQLAERETLEEVLKFSVAEQIKRDQEIIKELTTERDTYKGKAEEADKKVEEIKRAYETAKRNLENSLRAEKEKQLVDFKKNTNSKKVKPLEDKIKELESELNSIKSKLEQAELDKSVADKRVVEVETLLKSRDEEIERLKTIEIKVDTIYNYLTINLEEIKTMIINSKSKEEIIDTIEETEETLKSNGRLDDLERDIQIAKALANGESKSTVANKYLGHRSQPMAALSKKLKADRFTSLIEYFKGSIGEPPEAYKELIG